MDKYSAATSQNQDPHVNEPRVSRSSFITKELRAALRFLKNSEIKVWLYFASRANRERLAWPSDRRVVLDIGLSLRTIRTAKKRLQNLGMLVPLRQIRKNGKYWVKPVVVHEPCHEMFEDTERQLSTQTDDHSWTTADSTFSAPQVEKGNQEKESREKASPQEKKSALATTGASTPDPFTDSTSNGSVDATAGAHPTDGSILDVTTDVVDWMRKATLSAGRAWKHQYGNGNRGPTPAMEAEIRSSEVYVGATRFRSWWLDFVSDPKCDNYRFPYQHFLEHVYQSRCAELAERIATGKSLRLAESMREGLLPEEEISAQ